MFDYVCEQINLIVEYDPDFWYFDPETGEPIYEYPDPEDLLDDPDIVEFPE